MATIRREISNVRAEFLVDENSFIGRADWTHYTGKHFPDRYMSVVGHKLKTGSWQLYEMGHGTLHKLAVVKASTIDWSHLIQRPAAGEAFPA